MAEPTDGLRPDVLTTDILLQAYAMGIFPMADGRDSADIHWVEPRTRGLMPLDHRFHISRSLRRRLLRVDYEARIDTGFAQVVEACANRTETWINEPIRDAYLALFAAGHAHSMEIWIGERLVGGVYGVVLGSAFFGESMFSTTRDGSKLALAWLVHRLRAGGFTLFDTQFLTPHLASLGGYAMPQGRYTGLLADAILRPAAFDPPGYSPSAGSVAAGSPGNTQASGHTS